jgi:hypothetical protein
MQTATETRPRTGGRTRPFVADDLPQIVDLYLKAFPQGHQYSRNKLLTRFNHVLLENPWRNSEIRSLVYEKDGKVSGFLGVVVRPMLAGGEKIRVATSNHFMVDPGSRSMAGLELLSTLFSGPQELTIAEAGDDSRKLWEGLGGRTSSARSLFWTRALRPAGYALQKLQQRGAPRALGWIAWPFGKAFDALAVRIRKSPLHLPPEAPNEEASTEELLTCFSQLSKRSSLSPCYDQYSLNWLLAVLAEKKKLGTLRKVIVRGDRNEIAGWYLYYSNPGAVGTVLHMHATLGRIDQVFRHLCHDAWQHGAIALTGRVEPRFTKDLCRNHCLLHWRSWALVHSRNPKLLGAFDSGDAIFTALEGEWWISVEGETAE